MKQYVYYYIAPLTLRVPIVNVYISGKDINIEDFRNLLKFDCS